MQVNSTLKTAILVALVASWIPTGLAQSPVPAADAKKLTTELQMRVKQYLDLRKKIAGNPPKPSDSPVKLAAAQREFADKIRSARAGVKQGAIFTP